jgi:hypothetical protein
MSELVGKPDRDALDVRPKVSATSDPNDRGKCGISPLITRRDGIGTMLVSGPSMRIGLFGLVAVFVLGCGGKVEPEASDDNGDDNNNVVAPVPSGSASTSTSNTANACTFGKIADVGNQVTQIASSGNALYLVEDNPQYTMGPAANPLFLLRSDGSVQSLVGDVGIDPIVPYTSGVAFIVRRPVFGGGAGSEVDFVDSNGVSSKLAQVDSTSFTLSNLTLDAKQHLAWLRTGLDESQTFETSNGSSSIVDLAASSDFQAPFATDGSAYFGILTSSSGDAFGQLAVGGQAERRFTNFSFPVATSIFGVDATSVYYSAFGGQDSASHFWVASRADGTTSDIAALDAVTAQSAVLHAGKMYFGASSKTSMSFQSYDFATAQLDTLVSLTSNGNALGPMTTDSCGLVYVVFHPGDEQTSSIYRMSF